LRDTGVGFKPALQLAIAVKLVYRAQYMRGRLPGCSHGGSASTDAEVKGQGSLITADAALQDLKRPFNCHQQINVARTLAMNRQDQEREAYRATVDQMNQEVEANLTLPVEEIATVTPNF
jgi:hypothetical protein